MPRATLLVRVRARPSCRRQPEYHYAGRPPIDRGRARDRTG